MLAADADRGAVRAGDVLPLQPGHVWRTQPGAAAAAVLGQAHPAVPVPEGAPWMRDPGVAGRRAGRPAGLPLHLVSVDLLALTAKDVFVLWVTDAGLDSRRLRSQNT